MTKKLLLLAIALLSLGIAPVHAGEAPQAKPLSQVLAVDGVPTFRVTYVPGVGETAATMPEVSTATNSLGQSCVVMDGVSRPGADAQALSICEAGSAELPEASEAPRTHLPNPPFGLCFSQHVYRKSPEIWLFICVCVPNMHPAEPISGPYIFQDIEGNPAQCVGVKTGFNGFAWVCVLRP